MCVYIYIWYPPPSCIYRLSLVLLQVTLLHYDYKQRGSRSWLLSFVVLSLLLLSLWVCQCLRNETPKTLVLPMIPMIPMISGQSPQRPRADRLKSMEIIGIIGITNVSGKESWKSLVFTNGCDIHHSRNIGFTNGFDIQPARNIGFINGFDIHHSRSIGFTNDFEIQPARHIGFTNVYNTHHSGNISFSNGFGTLDIHYALNISFIHVFGVLHNIAVLIIVMCQRINDWYHSRGMLPRGWFVTPTLDSRLSCESKLLPLLFTTIAVTRIRVCSCYY